MSASPSVDFRHSGIGAIAADVEDRRKGPAARQQGAQGGACGIGR